MSAVKVVPMYELKRAFEAGRQAKDLGRFRVTPYYDCAPLDHFWLAGFDGKTWQEAIEGQ